MVKIGVINKTKDLVDAMQKLFEDIGQGDRIDAAIFDLSGRVDTEGFDILVINEYVSNREAAVSSLRRDGLLIMNADNKEIYHYLPVSPCVLITYGFSGKACVTASSVTDSEIQICIQRGLPTLDGRMLDEQEFGVYHKNTDKNVYSMLSAVTSAIVTGVEISEIALQPVV